MSSRQLAEDEYFQHWVRPDRADLALDAIWKAWLKANADRSDVVEEARSILLAIYHDRQQFPGPVVRKRTWKRIEDTLSHDLKVHKPSDSVVQKEESHILPMPPRLPDWYKWAAAAIVLMVASATIYFSGDNQRKVPFLAAELRIPNGAGMRVAEANSQSVTLVLEDGSSVVLQPHSKLGYPEHFGSHERKVTLIGEGFF